MPRTLGTLLHPVDQEHVLEAYTDRPTQENVAKYPVKFDYMLSVATKLMTDAQWLSSHTFAVRGSDGRLDRRSKLVWYIRPPTPEPRKDWK